MAQLLVIDDDELVRNTLASMLSSAGHTVATAVDGRAGTRAAATAAYDVILVDILMPEKEGIETIIELRRRQPAIKLVAISGGGRTDSVDFLDLAKQLGADAALRKPIAKKRLVETVDGLLNASTGPTPRG